MAGQINRLSTVSLAARVSYDMHNMNSEGGESNTIQTRMATIFLEGALSEVNALTGDMLRHALLTHYFNLARDRGLPLCAACKIFNVNRISADEGFLKETEGLGDSEFLDRLYPFCSLCEIAGFLVTTRGRSLPRKSVVEFSWLLGIPGLVETNDFFHVKYAPERGAAQRVSDAEATERTGANLGQNIFHRPASSGVYALNCHLELARIGYNDISHSYPVDEAERLIRTQVLLQSLMLTFLDLKGAMRASQLPHLVGIEGILSTSASAGIPAPMLSPLIGGAQEPNGYREQLKGIIGTLKSGGARLEFKEFDTPEQYARVMAALVESTAPLALAV